MNWRSDQLEPVTCDSCGNTAAQQVIIRPDGMCVVECDACGLAYLNPRPKADQIRLLYDRAYFGSSAGNSGIGYESYSDESLLAAHEATALNQLDIVGSHIELKGKRVLEIGCATGEFCQALARRGCFVVGVDLSHDVIELAKARYPQLDLRPGSLENAVLDEKFDVIFAWEVIEHVTSPESFVAEISRHLAPGGYTVLSTPNYACARHIQPSRWAGFQYSFEHLYFFDRRALESIGMRHGLRYVMSYSGGGSGLAPKPQRFRSFVRRVLSSTGMLRAAKQLRAAANPHGIGYSAGREDQHNLIVILQKDPAKVTRN